MNNIFIGDISVLLKSFFLDKKHSSIYVLVDENTYKYCYPLIEKELPFHECIHISSGEKHKNLATCEHVWSVLTEKQADRNALLINLGGGVITDMGGFCAVTYKRGIDFINIPTTLLGMIDASIGGKIGVDYNDYKNQLGYFQEPKCILIDKLFLKTLEKRQFISGIAEMLKHALISSMDVEKIVEAKELELLTDELIRDSINFKKQVVDQDFYESHYRKILNFGHTIGHAVESHFLKSKDSLLHGEAVFIGMICELYLSHKLAGFSMDMLTSTVEKITSIYSFRHFEELEIAHISSLSSQDKKNQENLIKAVLLEGLGSPKIDVIITQKEIEESLRYYNSIVK